MFINDDNTHELNLNYSVSALWNISGYNSAANASFSSKTTDVVVKRKVQKALIAHQVNESTSNDDGNKKETS